MKTTLLSTLLACALFSTSQAQAQQFVNLTPTPKEMRVENGTYRLPAQFTIGGTQLPDSIKAEAQKFVGDFNKSASGCTASFSNKKEGVAIELYNPQNEKLHRIKTKSCLAENETSPIKLHPTLAL